MSYLKLRHGVHFAGFPHFSKGGPEEAATRLYNLLSITGHEIRVAMTHPVNPTSNRKQLFDKAQVQFMATQGNNKHSHYLMLPL